MENTEKNEGGAGAPPQIKIDFNALAAPEGAQSVDLTFEGDPNQPIDQESLKDSLPNLDNDPTLGQKNPDSAPKNEGVDGNEGKNIQDAPADLGWLNQYVPILDKYKAKFGDDFMLPAGTTEENFAENLEFAISEQYSRKLDPRVSSLQKAIEDGVDPEEYFSTYKQMSDYTKMSDAELVRMSLEYNYGKNEKRENGWDEDKLKTVIDKMDKNGMLEIEAEKIREYYNSEKEQLHEAMLESKRESQTMAKQEASKTREKHISSAIESFNELNDVFGIPLSRSEKEEFQGTFKYLVTPDESGEAPAVKLLRSNENLAKVLYILQKGDKAIRNAIDKAKSGAKQDFLGKLDPEPRAAGKGVAHNPREIDFEALAAPEKYV